MQTSNRMNQPHYAKDARDLLELVRATIEQRKQINADLDELASREVEESVHCYRCNSSPCKPSCGMMVGGETTVLKPGEHCAYPDGRAMALQP